MHADRSRHGTGGHRAEWPTARRSSGLLAASPLNPRAGVLIGGASNRWVGFTSLSALFMLRPFMRPEMPRAAGPRQEELLRCGRLEPCRDRDRVGNVVVVGSYGVDTKSSPLTRRETMTAIT